MSEQPKREPGEHSLVYQARMLNWQADEIKALNAERTQLLREALADIAVSKSMTLAGERAKAKRIYECTASKDELE